MVAVFRLLPHHGARAICMALSAVWVAVLGWAALMEGCGAISCTNYDEFQVRRAQEGAEGSVVAQFPPLPYY